MITIRFRAWNKISNEYCSMIDQFKVYELNKTNEFEIEQFIGLHDEMAKEFYIGDIARFPNGDTFVLKIEDWLEVGVCWIGEPEREDQARDLYRIECATIIGNIHQNPELLK